MFGRQVVVDFGKVVEGGKEKIVVDFLGFFGKVNDFLIDFLQVILEDRVILRDMNIVEVFYQGLHVVLGELARGREEPVAEHGEFVDVELEEFYVGLSFFVVFLGIFLFVQGSELLLNGLQAGKDSR